MLYLLMVGCEIGFWVLLGAALVCRYRLGRGGVARALLLSVPLVDAVLLAATTADLARGAQPGTAHGLAAIYLGISLAFGPVMVAWADRRIGPLLGGPRLPAPPRSGPEHAARERGLWLRHLAAWSIGAVLILLQIAVVDDHARTAPLLQTLATWAVVVAADFVWSFSYTLFPRKPRP